MWIVDDDGDMFNTDHYSSIKYCENEHGRYLIHLIKEGYPGECFKLSYELNEDERLTRYYDLVEKLTGERIDG